MESFYGIPGTIPNPPSLRQIPSGVHGHTIHVDSQDVISKVGKRRVVSEGIVVVYLRLEGSTPCGFGPSLPFSTRKKWG